MWEIISTLLGSSVFVGSLGAAVRFGAPALAEAKLTREKASLTAKEARAKQIEIDRLEAEQRRLSEENTGKIYKDQRHDIEAARGESEDCRKELKRVEADCIKRDVEWSEKFAALAMRVSQVDGQPPVG